MKSPLSENMMRDSMNITLMWQKQYEINDSMKVVYQQTDTGFSITITGVPEARDKFYSDAKASIAKSKREYPDDAWVSTWSAKISGDKITVSCPGD